ncbi:MAG: hypothetical protein NVS1B10_08900 [Candidatus Saccharimonadales bacterium]
MSQPSNSRAVKAAYLQSGITIAGKCSSETNMQVVLNNHSKLRMYMTADGLHLDFGDIEALIPAANVKVVVYEPNVSKIAKSA